MESANRQKISTSVLTLVDQLNAKLVRLKGEIQAQERISRALDTQLLTLREQHQVSQQDLKRTNASLDSQKYKHQKTLNLTQAQSKNADQFQRELAMRRKERKEVEILI